MNNTKKTRNKVKKNVEFNGLTVKNPNSAGIDIGSRDHWVAVAPHLTKDRIRSFPTFTCNLHEISNWLIDCNVQTIAMESTGIYWIPLLDILEDSGFEVNLCNARHVKNLPGRQKTDALDCAWIQKLHSFGLLSASFIPNIEIRALRTLMRYRENLTQENTRHVLRMQKFLTLMNVLLPKVLSDITGQTGTNIIKAIIAGKTNPKQLLKLKNKKVKASDELFLKALEGDYQHFYIKALSYEMKHYEYIAEKIRTVDIDTDMQLTKMIKLSSPEYDDSIVLSDVDKLIALIGVDLTQVPGFSVLSIRKLISETGLDMSKWKDAKHFSSWLRLSPSAKKSGGKMVNSETLSNKPRAAIIFRMCAGSLRKNKSPLGDFLRRKMAHKHYAKAITATARKLSVIYYNMLKFKSPYVQLDPDYYAQQHKERVINNLRKSAERLGFSLIETVE